MDFKIIKDEKDTLDIEIGNITIVELLRVYLNKNGAKMAVWKRDHPLKNPILHLTADKPREVLKKAIEEIDKEIDDAVSEVKKIK